MYGCVKKKKFDFINALKFEILSFGIFFLPFTTFTPLILKDLTDRLKTSNAMKRWTAPN